MTVPTAADRSDPHPGISFAEFVVLIAALMALNALGIDAMLPALPAIADGHRLPDPNEAQTTITAYLVGFGVAQLLFGPLADRFGRKSVLIAGLALYTAASIASVFTPTFEALLVSRLIQGIGCAAPRVIAISVVRDCYGGRDMARVMSLAMTVFIIVPVIAPSIGQVMMLMGSWHWVFWLLAAGGFVTIGWTALRLPETLPLEHRKSLQAGAILANYTEAVTTRQAFGYTLAAAVLFGGLFGFLGSAQQIFVDVYDLGAAFPVVFALVALAVSAASFANARLVERLGMRRLSHGSLFALIAIFALHTALVLAGLSSIYTFVVLMAAGLFPFGIMLANFNALAMAPLGHIAGTASAMNGFISMTGGAVVGFFIGQAFDGTILPLVAGFGLTGVAALAIVLVVERGKLFHPAPGHA